MESDRLSIIANLSNAWKETYFVILLEILEHVRRVNSIV